MNRLEHIRWTLENGMKCTVREQKELLAVAEAAAEYVTSVRREADLPENLETDAEFDEYERVLLRIDAAKDALVATSAPLMEEEE